MTHLAGISRPSPEGHVICFGESSSGCRHQDRSCLLSDRLDVHVGGAEANVASASRGSATRPEWLPFYPMVIGRPYGVRASIARDRCIGDRPPPRPDGAVLLRQVHHFGRRRLFTTERTARLPMLLRIRRLA